MKDDHTPAITQLPKGRIPALDGLRGIAILLVIAGHAAEAYLGHEPALWQAPFFNSSLGVRLFFVLSGFLITGLLVKEWDRHGKLSLSAFYARRSIRIFPAFYLYIAVIAALSFAGFITVSQSQFIAAASYTWNYLGTWAHDQPIEGSWFLGHLWTLSLEEQFYIFWPTFIILAGWRKASITCAVLPILLPFLRIAWYFLFPEHRGYLGMMFHTAIDSILIGCAFALWSKKLPNWLSTNRIVLILAFVFAFFVSPLLAHSIRGYGITVGFGLDGIACGIMILQTFHCRLWEKVLSFPALVLIGMWSYSLYLWQQLFLTSLNTTWSGSFPLSLLALTACALASFYLVEQPLLRLKKRFERS